MPSSNLVESLGVVERAGLDASEAKLYTLLLTLGGVSHQRLATRAQINRSSSYAIIDRLKKKGLVALRSKAGKQIIVPVAPKRLLELEEERLDYLKEHLPIVEQLSKNLGFLEWGSSMQYFEGKEGLKSVLSLILEENKEVRIFGDGDAFKRIFAGWADLYSKKRQEKNIKARLLLKGTPLAIDSAKRRRGSALSQIRVLPQSYPIVGGFDVVGTKVVLYSFTEDVVAVVIEHKIISTLLATVFDILWQEAEKYDRTLLR